MRIYVTTAGMFSLAPMACLIHMCCADKVLYSVDYPFCSELDGVKFMYQLKESGMINDQDFEAICYRNAERLLDVRVPTGPLGPRSKGTHSRHGSQELKGAGNVNGNGYTIGLEVGSDGGASEEERRKMPWLMHTNSFGLSENGVSGGSSAFPMSPMDTVHEERF